MVDVKRENPTFGFFDGNGITKLGLVFAFEPTIDFGNDSVTKRIGVWRNRWRFFDWRDLGFRFLLGLLGWFGSWFWRSNGLQYGIGAADFRGIDVNDKEPFAFVDRAIEEITNLISFETILLDERAITELIRIFLVQIGLIFTVGGANELNGFTINIEHGTEDVRDDGLVTLTFGDDSHTHDNSELFGDAAEMAAHPQFGKGHLGFTGFGF